MNRSVYSKIYLKEGLRFLLSASRLFVIFLCLCTSVYAQENSEKAVADAAQGLLNPKFQIDNVKYIKELNMYRITVNGNYMHMTPDMRYAFVGDVVDVRAGRSILYSPQNIKFADLPLKDAIKKGNGKHKIALFVDLNCSFCNKQYQELAQEKDITVYVYLLGFMNEESAALAAQIKASKNPISALDEFLLNDKHPTVKGKVDSAFIKRNAELARTLNIRSTPTIFYTDGSSAIGYQPLANIRAAITKATKGE